MFAGDNEYKTNFFLKFKSDFTSMRFKHDRYLRLISQIKGTICFSLLTVITSYIFVWDKTSPKIYACILMHGLIWYLLQKRYEAIYLRLCFLFLEYVFHEVYILYFLPHSFSFYIIFSHIPTFIFGNSISL